MTEAIIALARGEDLDTVVSDNRDILADLFYTGRDAGIAFRAVPVAGRPPHHYAMSWPFEGSDAPVLYVGDERARLRRWSVPRGALRAGGRLLVAPAAGGVAGPGSCWERLTRRLPCRLRACWRRALPALRRGSTFGSSGLFYDGHEFPLARSAALETLRNGSGRHRRSMALAALGLWLAWLPLGSAAIGAGAPLGMGGRGLRHRARHRSSTACLKEHWGRARPAYVLSRRGRVQPRLRDLGPVRG